MVQLLIHKISQTSRAQGESSYSCFYIAVIEGLFVWPFASAALGG